MVASSSVIKYSLAHNGMHLLHRGDTKHNHVDPPKGPLMFMAYDEWEENVSVTN